MKTVEKDLESKVVKVKSVSLTVYPWTHSSGKTHWRFAWYDQNGMRRYTTKAIKAEAITAARAKAKEIHNGTLDLGNLNDEQARLCRAFLDLKPDWKLIERLKDERKRGSVTLSNAFEQFIEAKEANSGNSPHNVRTLRNRTGALAKSFGEKPIASLTVADLDRWLLESDWAPRTKLNIRSSIVTFFRWCRLQGILSDRTTEADKMAKPIVMRSAPSTYTPSELSTMLNAVRPEFKAWLALSAWAGMRNEELYPHRNSDKDALSWENIDFKKKIIIVPREVSKTNERRIIPICDPLFKILTPLAQSSGRITGHRSPSDRKHGDLAETLYLGKLVGGWKINALRHSFVSYRCALVGVAQAAMEAGNSESETRRSYRDAKGEEEAKEWFSCGTLAEPKTHLSETH